VSEIVVLGGGGHAKVLINLLAKLNWKIVGYTDEQDRGAILGAPYVGDDAVLPDLRSTHHACLVAVGLGKIDASSARVYLYRKIRALGFDCPVIVSPRAVVNEEVVFGAGTAVFDGAVVNTGTVAGSLCIMNTNSTVEHDCRLGDNVHVAPGATVCGSVAIGNDCMIGAGSTIMQEVTVCPGSLVGAGAVVVSDIESPGVYAGNPARRIR
jgi:sugar O-acyltransferase (sialic acid O-acetyltransferase NeuD family)